MLQSGLDIDLNEQSLELKSGLKFLQLENDKYLTKEREFTAEIKILNDVEYNPVIINEEKVELNEKHHRIGSIEDDPKGEVISATKISVFKQCPLKYHLTYDIGFLPFFQNYKKWMIRNMPERNYEFNEKEDETLFGLNKIAVYKNVKEFSDVKGRIIHSALQKEIIQDQLSDFIDVSINNEIGTFKVDEKQKVQLKNDITADIKNFYNSNEFSDLKKYKNYNNEYEVYAKENDYYLYGIIDKLIIEGDKAIIVDYKTDSITEKQLEEKSNSYFSQLRFYSYIVNRLFDKIKFYELKLIFIKWPQYPQIINFSNKDFEAIKREIKTMVNNIRRQNYLKNLTHCKTCSYSLNNNICIKN